MLPHWMRRRRSRQTRPLMPLHLDRERLQVLLSCRGVTDPEQLQRAGSGTRSRSIDRWPFNEPTPDRPSSSRCGVSHPVDVDLPARYGDRG